MDRNRRDHAWGKRPGVADLRRQCKAGGFTERGGPLKMRGGRQGRRGIRGDPDQPVERQVLEKEKVGCAMQRGPE